MYYLYILRSIKDAGYYIGISENVEQRLKEHNHGKTKSTKNRMPFVIAGIEEYTDKTMARKREIMLKKNYQERTRVLKELGFDIK